MSWSMRDGSYPFLRHFGPFGCIKPAVFSENSNLSKNRFSENLDSTISTGHLEQKKWFFAIFHKQPHTQSLWKIAKNRSHLAKFGCGSGAILVILFKKMWFFSSKIRKKWKTASKIILKIINIILSTYSRIYQKIRSFKYFKKYF